MARAAYDHGVDVLRTGNEAAHDSIDSRSDWVAIGERKQRRLVEFAQRFPRLAIRDRFGIGHFNRDQNRKAAHTLFVGLVRKRRSIGFENALREPGYACALNDQSDIELGNRL